MGFRMMETKIIFFCPTLDTSTDRGSGKSSEVRIDSGGNLLSGGTVCAA